MNPEAADAIRIADKHLAGESPERRMALAKDISEAIIRHADMLVKYAIRTAVETERKKHYS